MSHGIGSSLQPYLPSQSLVLASVLAFVALPTSISFLPLVAFLASLLAHFSSPTSTPLGLNGSTAGSILYLSLGASLARIGPSLEALSTPSISILALFAGSIISILISLIPISIFIYSAPRIQQSTTRLLLFPAIWATALGIASHGSPLGRLGVWSPVYGMRSFRWLVPIFGEVVQDWIVGVSVLLVLQVAEAAGWTGPLLNQIQTEKENDLLVHAEPSEVRSPLDWPNDAEHEHLIEAPAASATQTAEVREYPVPTAQNAQPPRRIPGIRTETVLTATILALLAAPSIIAPEAFHAFPSPVIAPGEFTQGVACIMPVLSPSTSPKTIFEAYRAESARYASRADIHLWPESAVRFDTALERKEYLEEVRLLAQGTGTWIGVSFDDFAPPTPGSNQREGMRRNGMVLVGPEGPVFEYFKQNLVPVTESFSIIHSAVPPTVHTINIPYGEKKKNRPKPTHPVRITGAICLDFAHPSIFQGLPGHADLILAPGKTWDTRIGEAMHEQVALRADEVGSVALWCDAGGLSGVAGQGEGGVQRGRGSFVRKVGIPWDGSEKPDEKSGETFYAKTGDLLALGLVWAALLASLGQGQIVAWARGVRHQDARRIVSLASPVFSRFNAWYDAASRLVRRNKPEEPRATGNLIDV